MTGRRGPRAWVAVTVALLSGAVASCSPAGSGDASDEGPAPGQFVVARTADIDMLDPHRATAFQTVQTLGLVYGNLVDVDRQGQLQPDLATSWKVTDDGRTVTFALRKGVTFHNGATFTAADAKASIERIVDEKTGGVAASNLTSVQSMDTPDANTLVLHLAGPDSALPYALASVNAAVVDQEDISAGSVGKKPNGTGPFRFGSWKQNQQVTLPAFKAYWGGAPKLDEVVFRIIPDESSILAGMRSGNFSLATISDPSVAQQANGDEMELVKQPALSYHALMLNGRIAPLNNIAVRQAIACGVDRRQLVDTAANGDGEITGPITSPAFRYSSTEGLPCTPPDRHKAKELIRGAGYGPGNPVILRTIVMTGEYATAAAEAQNLQAQLKKIGVELQLEQEQSSSYVKRWLASDFDAAVALNGGSSHPFLMYGRYYTADGSLAKPAGLDSDALHQLLTAGNTQTSISAQRSAFGSLQRELLRLSPWVWTFRGDDYYLVDPAVQGFVPTADQSLKSLADASVGGS